MKLTDQLVLKAMENAALAAAKVVNAGFRKSKIIKSKTSHQDVVTNIDVKSQKIIKKKLNNYLNKLNVLEEDIRFISEEDSNTTKPAKHTFIIDPIDGTTNFAAGLRYFAISIAYAKSGNITSGFVYDPINKTRFWAQRKQGSWVKYNLEPKHKLLIRNTKPLTNWVVSGHYNAMNTVANQFKTYQKIYPHIRGLRTMGCLILELCELANEHFDLVLNGGTYIWDLAAAKLIIEEAGGRVLEKNGKKLILDFSNPNKVYKPIAGHPINLEKFLSMSTKLI